MALDGVMWFLGWKDFTNTCKHLLAGFPQCNGRKLEEAGDFKCIFILYCALESK